MINFKIFKICVLVLACLMCAGCFQAEVNITVNDDGTITTKNKILANVLMAGAVERAKDDMIRNSTNAKVQSVTEGDLTGYIVEITYEDLDKFKMSNSNFYQGTPGKSKGIQKFGGWFYDEYSIDLVFENDNLRNNGTYDDMASMAMAQAMLSQVKFDFTINLPYAAEDNNADSVTNDGHTLTWNIAQSLTSGHDKHIQANFKVYNVGEIAVTILVVLILIGGVAFNVMQSKKYVQ